MDDKRVRVTVFDPLTGVTEQSHLPPDSYILLCGERCELTYRQCFANGTEQLTIKTQLPPQERP